MGAIYAESSNKSPSLNNNEGFALVVVLWLLGLLSLIVISVTYSVGFEVRSSANIANRIRSELLADGFTRLIIADVTEKRNFSFGAQPLSSGVPFACQHRDRIVVATITDTRGLLDLNSGDPNQMVLLLTAAGLTRARAKALQAAIEDYRDADNNSKNGGLETERYASLGLIHLPKNGPFESVEELDQVHGMPANALPILRQYLTVRSYNRAVNAKSAPALLLHALSGSNPDLSGIVGHAISKNSQSRESKNGYEFTADSRAFEIRVMVSDPTGANSMRHAVAEITPGRNRGYSVLQWQKIPASNLELLMAKNAAFYPCFE